MISHLEREVTFRFLRTRKNDGFLNIISIFSFIGISLGVAVLIIVMSVMNGFRTELITKIVGFNAHAVVQAENKSLKYIQDLDLAKNIVSNDGEAVILNKNITKGVFLKGYLESDFRNLQIVKNKEFFGSQNLNDNNISILSLVRDGQELSKKISETLSLDEIKIYPDIIDPYIQAVGDTADKKICEHTGLKLTDIYRYFRYTWITPSNSIPGRLSLIHI